MTISGARLLHQNGSVATVALNDPLITIFQPQLLSSLQQFESSVANITVELTPRVTPLSSLPMMTNSTTLTITQFDLCFRPIPSRGCILQSATEYYVGQNLSQLTLSQSIAVINDCSGAGNTKDRCRGTIGIPTFPYVVLGGYPIQPVQNATVTNYTQATSLIVTWLLNDFDPLITDSMSKQGL